MAFRLLLRSGLVTRPVFRCFLPSRGGRPAGRCVPSGTEGYHTYRIPAVVLSNKGTVLAFCEGRKASSSDAGDIDLMLRRSTDGGKTWQPMQLVYEEGGEAKIRSATRVPSSTQHGHDWLPFCRNNDRVFITKSTDDGLTWDKPIEMTHSTIGCLYERDDYRQITFARFTLGWLTDGKDQP